MLLKVTLRKRLLLCEVQHGADKPEIIRYETGKVIQSKGWSLFCAKVQLLCKKGGVLVEQIVIYLGWLSGSSFRRWHSLECMFYPCFVKYPRLFPGVLNSPLTLSIENPTWDAFSSIVFNIAFEGTQIFRAVIAKKPLLINYSGKSRMQRAILRFQDFFKCRHQETVKHSERVSRNFFTNSEESFYS